MRRRINAVRACLAALALFAASGAVVGDTYLKEKTVNEAYEMMGTKTPAKEELSTTWFGKDKAARIGQENTVIFRADKGVVYMLNKAQKEYTEIPVGKLSAADTAENEAMMKAMTAAMGAMKITVTPTDETRKIGSWKATKYVVEIAMGTMSKTTQQIWTTEDLEVDYDLYKGLARAMLSRTPMYQTLQKELDKMKGVPVLVESVTEVMGNKMTVRNVTLECGSKDAPAGVYEIPPGYKKTDAMSP